MIETIKENTQMLLFRFRDYKSKDFIEEHTRILLEKGFVWMLKAGKKTSERKLRQILDDGGWMILRAPKSKGSKMFLAQYTTFQCIEPKETIYPTYYTDFINQDDDEDEYYRDNTVLQWFRLISLVPFPEKSKQCIVLSKSFSPVDNVIKTTRTAVMFVTNIDKITLE